MRTGRAGRASASSAYGGAVTFPDLPLSRATVDRAADLRTDPTAVTRAIEDATTRVVLVADGAVATVPDERAAGASPDPANVTFTGDVEEADARLALLDVATARTVRGTPDGPDDWFLLGRDEHGLVLALRVPGAGRPRREGAASDLLVHEPVGAPGWSQLRLTAAGMSARDAGLATAAVALDAWHARHPRCPRCGATTASAQGGWVRVCTQDGSEHYPRTDPAVIMAVVDEVDRLLLGHNAAWASGRYSIPAGFVESGESLEQAVRREVLEETGVHVGAVQFVASQPWPFPASLMVGFRARALSTALRPDGVEVTQVGWYARDELAGAVRAGTLVPPGRTSIARALIEDWFGGPLPRPAARG